MGTTAGIILAGLVKATVKAGAALAPTIGTSVATAGATTAAGELTKKDPRRPLPVGDIEAEKERARRLRQVNSAQGRSSTILTGPQGLGRSSSAGTGTGSTTGGGGL
jgi:hypothetical protein